MLKCLCKCAFFSSVYFSKQHVSDITEHLYTAAFLSFPRALLVLLVLQASQVLLVLRYEHLLLLVHLIVKMKYSNYYC